MVSKLTQDPMLAFVISQHDAYVTTGKLTITAQEALRGNTIAYMDKHKKNSITGETSLYILPGYTFRICKALITNFHQPGSTLIATGRRLYWRRLEKSLCRSPCKISIAF